MYKVGKTTNFEQRLKSYKCSNPTIEVVGTFFVLNYDMFERNFHRKHKSVWLNEWYSEQTIIESGILNMIVE